MALNFPSNPITNTEYTFGTKTWVYNGFAWDLKTNATNLLEALKTVDSIDSGLDADLLDGNHSDYYTDIVARLGFTPYNAANPSTLFVGDTTTALITDQGDYSSPLIIQRSDNAGKSAIILRGSDGIGTAIEFGRSNPLGHWGTYFEFLVHENNTYQATSRITRKLRIDGAGVDSIGALKQSGNQVLHAGNYSSYALPLSGGTGTGNWYTSANVGSSQIHLRSDSLENYTSTSDTGAVVVNYYGYNSGTSYFRDFIVFDGKGSEKFKVVGSSGAVTIAGNQVLHAGNYTGYSPGYTGSGGALRIQTPSGYAEIGPMNSSWCHVYSDKSFYFNQGIWINNSRVLDAGNYTSYSPSLTGSGASGTWGISVTGSAGSVSGITLTNSANGINPDNVTQNQIGYNTSVSLFGQTDGGLYSSAYGSSWIHQIYGDFRTGQIAVRGKNSGTWQAWRTVLDSSNFTNYAPGSYSTWSFTDVYANSWLRNYNVNTGLYNQATSAHWYSENDGSWTAAPTNGNYGEIRLRQGHQGTYKGSFYWDSSGVGLLNETGGWSVRCSYGSGKGGYLYGTWNGDNIRANRANTNLYIDDNYGYGVVGVYSSTRYQGVFAMGDAYKLPADGTSTGGLYGMAWSHPNAGGAAGNLTDHGLLIINNGGFRCAISNSIVASGNVTAYSDERLKTNWREMPENYVARLAQVKVGIYDRTDEEDTTQVGVGAQSFQQLLPQAIMVANDDMKTLSVSYGNAALASAVELAKDNVELRARIERLESLIEQLLNKE